ncbi:MAG TPA: hypothetical protein VGP83_05270 [Pyrinomonadaceae bacterium]|nr:hypothetical protein [Pyrinomonadaceae bacterium]
MVHLEATKKLRIMQCCRHSRMSSRTVVIDGVTYVRSRDAARVVNLTADYVSRLARAGLVAGKLVMRRWT